MLAHTLSDDVLTVRLKGEIDHHTVPAVRTELDELIRKTNPIKTVMDFAAVTFCDSSGISLVMGRYRAMTAAGGILELRAVPEKIKLIFTMAGVDRHVKMVEKETAL